jgi:hypothetical protein
MKKLSSFITLLALILITTFAAAAQSPANYRDSSAWDSPPAVGLTLTGYDIVFAQTNVTSAQLGNSNTIPTLAGVMGKQRTGATNLTLAFNSLLASSPVTLPYTLWARTVATPIGLTNIMVSGWTNIVVSWTDLPLPPLNLRIVQAP